MRKVTSGICIIIEQAKWGRSKQTLTSSWTWICCHLLPVNVPATVSCLLWCWQAIHITMLPTSRCGWRHSGYHCTHSSDSESNQSCPASYWQWLWRVLENLIDDKEFTAFTNTGDAKHDAKNRAVIDELVNENFEKQKTFFGRKTKKDNEDKHIRLPYEFVKTYKDALEEGIQYTGDSWVQLAGDCQELQINYSKMEEFFQPVISGILECISQALTEVEGKVGL